VWGDFVFVEDESRSFSTRSFLLFVSPGVSGTKIIVSGGSAPAPPLPVGLKASEKSAFRLPQGCAFDLIVRVTLG
jgi:hypothetical protein